MGETDNNQNTNLNSDVSNPENNQTELSGQNLDSVQNYGQNAGYNNGQYQNYAQNAGYNNGQYQNYAQNADYNNGQYQNYAQNADYNGQYQNYAQNTDYNNGQHQNCTQNTTYNNGQFQNYAQNTDYNNGQYQNYAQNTDYNNGQYQNYPQNTGYNNGQFQNYGQNTAYNYNSGQQYNYSQNTGYGNGSYYNPNYGQPPYANPQAPWQQAAFVREPVSNVFYYILMALTAVSTVVSIIFAMKLLNDTMSSLNFNSVAGQDFLSIYSAMMADITASAPSVLYTLFTYMARFAILALSITDIVIVHKKGYPIVGLILFTIFCKPGYFLWRAYTVKQKKLIPVLFTVFYVLAYVVYFIWCFSLGMNFMY